MRSKKTIATDYIIWLFLLFFATASLAADPTSAEKLQEIGKSVLQGNLADFQKLSAEEQQQVIASLLKQAEAEGAAETIQLVRQLQIGNLGAAQAAAGGGGGAGAGKGAGGEEEQGQGEAKGQKAQAAGGAAAGGTAAAAQAAPAKAETPAAPVAATAAKKEETSAAAVTSTLPALPKEISVSFSGPAASTANVAASQSAPLKLPDWKVPEIRLGSSAPNALKGTVTVAPTITKMVRTSSGGNRVRKGATRTELARKAAQAPRSVLTAKPSVKNSLSIQTKTGTQRPATRGIASQKRKVPLMPEPSDSDLLEDSEAEGGHRE